ncbi:MAG: ferredoxin reductase family protein, partial [Anaerolineales bacterium]
MQPKAFGNWAIVVLVIVNIVLWLLFPPVDDGKPTFLQKYASEMASSSAVILMASAQVLALRPRVLEPYFGGLDKMYVSHKNAALAGVVLAFTHFASMPLMGSEWQGGNIGIAALVGLVGLALLALAPRIPILGGHLRLAYHHWRWTHKFIGAFFILGLLHVYLVPTLIRTTPVPQAFVWTIGLIGAAAYIYKELLAPFIGKRYPHTVEATRKLNGTTLEVTLKTNGPKPAYRSGQFLFVSFEGDLGEPHPFTISSAPSEPHLRLSIKASGDWTRRMVEKLQPGRAATVYGTHGMFDYKAGGPQQIWIAGGIGLTPFLSWVRDFDSAFGVLDRDIHFFHTVRGEGDVMFWEEFEAAAQKHARFRPTLTVSSRDGSLTMDKITAKVNGNYANTHVYLCGPVPMT